MVTITDVARRAGVSASTVSHVLNNTRFVSEEARERVLEAIDTLDYVPNHQARSLVRSKTQQIGVAMSALTNLYFGEVVHAIEEATSKVGYTLVLADTHDDPATEARVVAALRERRLDGLLLAPSSGAAKVLDRLARTGLPTVLVDRSPDARFDAVCSENVKPVAQLVLHLAQRGHRRIAMVAGMAGLTTSEERVTGYRKGLAAAGLPEVPELMVRGGSDAERTRVVVGALLDLPDPPTAIVAAQNTMVIATMRTLQERGLSVPGDIAVVGFDDFEWAEVFSPRLTTVAQDAGAIGSKAVELLLRRIAGSTSQPKTVRIPAVVQHRESCGCTQARPGGTHGGSGT
ncbi:LacI family DNA-binding transcriptional regulator [Cellulomonas carbonis]|uniref:LacI family transcriptional regulator n=1 Tax=Cellulomonas carbonis T26 TaxID=947969 RepID=A0A0A0BXI9_9CELL|nr:LacI family DNA-binding transcriptional regulator [Cellulomonas carbonis]KGM12626.1 LacI family transcriptional regulator [Cellulomonas carbonis T26]